MLDFCLDHGFDFFSTLPGSFNLDLIEAVQRQERVVSVPLVREESGVALNAGAYLGGRKTAMIIQNQGLGNMEGQLLVLNSHLEGSYRFPNLYLITHRGLDGERIQAQKPMGMETQNILDRAGIKQCSVKKKLNLRKIETLLKEYEKGYSVAVTIEPDFGRTTNREISKRTTRRLNGISFPYTETETDMTRYEAISTIMEQVEDEFLVSNIGLPSRELHHIRDRDRNFYLTSSLGQTYMMALGLALSIDDLEEKIVCLEGDGGLLMNPGSLALVADQKPKNLVIIALDNAVYGSTGNIPTYASKGLNLSALALSYGFRKSNVLLAENQVKLREALNQSVGEDGPFFIHTLLKPRNERVPVIPLKNTDIKKRFMESIRKARKLLS